MVVMVQQKQFESLSRIGQCWPIKEMSVSLIDVSKQRIFVKMSQISLMETR
jgi:hypothetical protein